MSTRSNERETILSDAIDKQVIWLFDEYSVSLRLIFN